MSSAADLGDLQGWLQTVVTHPDGVAAGATATGLPIDAVVRPSSRLTAEQRLHLYHRGYHLRLLECMRALYPALRHALTEELFDAFALDYLRARPSRSYTLFRLTEGFAGHLEATRPHGEELPDFIIDLARLERTFLEVYEGPGVEGEALVGSPDLPEEPWLDATVEPVCCLRLLRARFPVAVYLGGVRRGEDPPLPRPAATFLAVSRRDYVVTVAELNAHQHSLLQALLAGARLGEAAATLEPSEAWESVRAWADRGFFRTVRR
jgi:hypothetical protein